MKIKVKILDGSVNNCKKGDIIEIEESHIEALAKDNTELDFEKVGKVKPKKNKK